MLRRSDERHHQRQQLRESCHPPRRALAGTVLASARLHAAPTPLALARPPAAGPRGAMGARRAPARGTLESQRRSHWPWSCIFD